jgi:hypothetical protein
MYTPKISTKRVLGLVLATALAASGTVAFASSSEAAVASVKPSPSTSGTVAGTVVTITGKNFQNAAGVSKVGAVYFSLVTCAVANKLVTPAGNINVVSETKLSITTPTLALTSSPTPTVYNICIDDAADANVVGTAKFTSYVVPTINDSTAATKGVSVLTGASYGGGTIVILGENFTSKATAKIGTLPIQNVKVVKGPITTGTVTSGDDTLTGTIPAGTGIDKNVTVTTEGGTVTAIIVAGATNQQFDYLEAIKVSPSFGDGTPNNVIAVTGTGFLSKSFMAATPTAGKSVIVLNTATVQPAAGGLFATAIGAGGVYCGSIQVESDTTLSCKVPDLTTAAKSGGYTVQIADGAGGAGTTLVSVTAISKSATYTVSAF